VRGGGGGVGRAGVGGVFGWGIEGGGEGMSGGGSWVGAGALYVGGAGGCSESNWGGVVGLVTVYDLNPRGVRLDFNWCP